MIRIAITLLSVLAGTSLVAQTYSVGSIFSHNDYEGREPFYGAYNQHAGYIEADVFVSNNSLLVGHSRAQLDPARTLEAMYILPLQEKIAGHPGKAYEQDSDSLVLMIDLKTPGPETLPVIVDLLEKYPDVRSCKTLKIAVSGNVPDPASWREYPDYIFFDGRPGKTYSQEQLRRIAFISTDFNHISHWKGHAPIPEKDREALKSIMNKAHGDGKKMRFWATPDGPEAWGQLMALGVDILNTDDVKGLAAYIHEKE